MWNSYFIKNNISFFNANTEKKIFEAIESTAASLDTQNYC